MPDKPIELEAVPVVYIWPEQVEAWQFFKACGTQWLHGFGGPTGLNYPGVDLLMERRHVPRRRRDDLWRAIWAMEQGALEGWAQRHAESRRD